MRDRAGGDNFVTDIQVVVLEIFPYSSNAEQVPHNLTDNVMYNCVNTSSERPRRTRSVFKRSKKVAKFSTHLENLGATRANLNLVIIT